MRGKHTNLLHVGPPHVHAIVEITHPEGVVGVIGRVQVRGAKMERSVHDFRNIGIASLTVALT